MADFLGYFYPTLLMSSFADKYETSCFKISRVVKIKHKISIYLAFYEFEI